MEYSIAFVVFAAVLWGMIFLVQKFLERVDPSAEKNGYEQIYSVCGCIGSDCRNQTSCFEIKKRSCEKIISRFFTAPSFCLKIFQFFPKDNLTRGEGFFHINQSLVAAAAKLQLQRAFCQQKRSIHKHITFL